MPLASILFNLSRRMGQNLRGYRECLSSQLSPSKIEEVDDFKTAISQAFHSLYEFLSSSSIYIITYFSEKVKSFSVSLAEEPVVSGDHKKGFSEFLSHFLYILYHTFVKKSNFNCYWINGGSITASNNFCFNRSTTNPRITRRSTPVSTTSAS